MRSTLHRTLRFLRSVPTNWVIALIVVVVLLATTKLVAYLASLVAAILLLNGIFHVGLAIRNFFSRMFATISNGIRAVISRCRIEEEAS